MIKLKVKRRYKGDYTIGSFYINGGVFCDSLEDKDRGLDSSMPEAEIREVKISGETAIPCGEYAVQMGVVSRKFHSRSWATRWGGKIPRLLNVPGFDGILIHPGTDKDSTSGCIIIGENKIKGKVINSVATFDKLMSQLVEADYRGDEIRITIE